MAGLINLPGYNPGPGVNFQPIQNALNQVNESAQFNRQNALAQEQLGMQKERLGMDKEQHEQKQQMMRAQRVGGLAQMGMTEQDPVRRQAILDRIISMHPDKTKLGPEYLRAETAFPMLVQEAQGFVDPLERRKTEATIGMTGAHADYYRAQAEKARREASAEGAYGKDAKFFQDPNTGNTYAIQFGAGGQPKYHLIQSPGHPGPQSYAPPAPPATGATRFAQPSVAPQAQPRPLQMVGTTVAGRTMFDRFGQPIRDLTDTIEGKEAAEEIGKARGMARANLDKIEQSAASTLRYIDDVARDPNLDSVIGPVDSWTPNFFNKGVQAKIDQLGGRAFNEAFASLKGAGAITEQEGLKASLALSRLSNQGMSQAEYRQAIADFKREVVELTEIARRKAGGGGGNAPGATASPAAAPKRLRYNPATGELE